MRIGQSARAEDVDLGYIHLPWLGLLEAVFVSTSIYNFQLPPRDLNRDLISDSSSLLDSETAPLFALQGFLTSVLPVLSRVISSYVFYFRG
jgi:hypothetical protein